MKQWRDIIIIDEDKCDGCGICVNACHEGALEIIGGKAKLIGESLCDGFGDCLPGCPQDAIKIEKREVAPYDEKAVQANIAKRAAKNSTQGCPGIQGKVLNPKPPVLNTELKMQSQLGQWPCQIKLVNPAAPYFEDCHLLVAADCTAYAYNNFHNDFMAGKITIIGCPKLDAVDYTEKLTEIISNNNIKSVSILRMQVPCCTGIVNAVKQALINSGKMIPWSITIIGTDGSIVEQ